MKKLKFDSKFLVLNENEKNDINGGLVITGTMLIAGGGVVYAGYRFGKWIKHNVL